MLGESYVTLKRTTSSIRAVLPSATQDWKKEGATDTPRASEVIPVCARLAFMAITLKNVKGMSFITTWYHENATFLDTRNYPFIHKMKTFQQKAKFLRFSFEICHVCEDDQTWRYRRGGQGGAAWQVAWRWWDDESGLAVAPCLRAEWWRTAPAHPHDQISPPVACARTSSGRTRSCTLRNCLQLTRRERTGWVKKKI